MAKIEDNPSEEEQGWTTALDNLNTQMVTYNVVSKQGDDVETEAEAQKVAAAMRNVGDSHADPRITKEWHKKAQRFSKAGPSERVELFDDIGKGLLILLATPFLLAGAAIFAAGAIVYGAGTLVKGLGNVLTGGLLGHGNSDKNSRPGLFVILVLGFGVNEFVPLATPSRTALTERHAK